ncbi:protein of unknown function [Amycolatopsis xylanica]|uniref:DUF4873 domain-containing protein n=1 Tax=Amycolatopsis xylanica TaxID=589385 RepID=A0A1H3SM80_9PSEU|nr:DUF4873 domain-containing protein [Amycolatopsis xylanica]SDZ38827.1 protein of unknown function [Amycolatopsis xylanica]
MSEHDEDGYSGAAVLVLDGAEYAVEVELRGHFQPIDGFYRWYGRIKADDRIAEIAGGKKKPAEIRIPEGSAFGEISDPDPWGRYRIMGTSTPPFHVPTSLAELEDA